MSMNRVAGANPTSSRCKMWCDDCGRAVRFNHASKWKAAKIKCSYCGCSRLSEERDPKFQGKPEK